MQFDHRIAKVGTLTVNSEVGAFLSGLKESLRPDVQAQSPPNLNEAIGLAKVFYNSSGKELNLWVGESTQIQRRRPSEST